MKFEENEKVLAMYRAVCTLIDEGNDIHKMKVSDITQKAGIGKGTAYEYFRSKEELVGKALYYDFSIQFYALENMVKEKTSLKSAMDCCFVWLQEHAERPRLVMQLIKSVGAFQERVLPAGGEEECPHMAVIARILELLVQIGKAEGSIHPDISLKQAGLQILSQLLGFYAFEQVSQDATEEESIQTADFLYSNMIKCLQTP